MYTQDLSTLKTVFIPIQRDAEQPLYDMVITRSQNVNINAIVTGVWHNVNYLPKVFILSAQLPKNMTKPNNLIQVFTEYILMHTIHDCPDKNQDPSPH